jgi:hypothetical protein
MQPPRSSSPTALPGTARIETKFFRLYIIAKTNFRTNILRKQNFLKRNFGKLSLTVRFSRKGKGCSRLTLGDTHDGGFCLGVFFKIEIALQ